MPVRVTVDIAEIEDRLVTEEAAANHRTRKEQLEYIIESWCDKREKERLEE